MGLPSGLLWAKKNLDITQVNGFAVSEFQYACSYVSWGNVFMHNPLSGGEFGYNWGNVNNAAPWYDGQVYGDTPGCSIQSDLPISADVARLVAGGPWRMPSADEFDELFQYSDIINYNGEVIPDSTPNKLTTVNGIRGLYLQSRINGARLFFPASGFGHDTQLTASGAWGFYFTSSFYNAKDARSLHFDDTAVKHQDHSDRFFGLPIRPVWMDIG